MEALSAYVSNHPKLFPESIIELVFQLLVQWFFYYKIVSSTLQAQNS